jgi:hypothetical protein
MYYKINNIFTTIPEYYVADEATVIANPHLVCVVGPEQDAQQKINRLKQEYLEQEKERFSISKETIAGADTIWSAIDEVNDPEEYTYKVFNTFTGMYEEVITKTVALARREELKQQLITEAGEIFTVTTLTELPVPKTSLSENTYGPTVGDIPVEII